MKKLTDNPTKWKEVICQSNAVATLQGILIGLQEDNERKTENKRAFFLTGKTGVGKSTLARLTAEFVTKKEFVLENPQINAEWIDSVESQIALTAMERTVFIINELQFLFDKKSAHLFTAVRRKLGIV